ncbi:MAG: DMT family transporter [Calditerrivibrio sp.]|nr:DMT family transporter [Calditerrivibrio sp.]MCA1932105.1 DMT family transporter [Calditerrivibrio sp.]
MAYLLLVLTSLFWSGNFVLSKGINQLIPPISLGFWRWLIAGIILLPFSVKFLLSDIKLIKKNILYINLLAILGVSTFNTLIYTAVHYTSAINAILINSFVPIIILLVSFVIYRDKPSFRQISGIIISMVGIFNIMLRGEITKIFELSFNRGDILVIIAAFVWAVYTVLLKSFPKGLHPLSFLQSIIIFGIIYMFPFYINEYLTVGGFTLNIKTIGSILYVSIFASVIAFIFWNRAVKEVGANKAGPFVHLMPVFGTILAVSFLGETLYIYQIVGILLVFFGILISTKR